MQQHSERSKTGGLSHALDQQNELVNVQSSKIPGVAHWNMGVLGKEEGLINGLGLQWLNDVHNKMTGDDHMRISMLQDGLGCEENFSDHLLIP